MIKSFDELSRSGLNYQNFEKIRKEAQEKNKKGLKMGGIIGGAIALVGIILAISGMSGLGIALIIIGIIVFGVYFVVVNSKAKKIVKETVIGDMLKAIDPTFSYSEGDNDLIAGFKKSGFKKMISTSTVDDVFKGKINGMDFKLGEIEVSRDQGSGNDRKSVTIFKGAFAKAITTNSYAYTSVIPDLLESSLGKVGKFLQKADVTRLNQKNIHIAEDTEFEKQFSVWTKDEQSARVILNPEFRGYLTKISSMFPIYVGWRDENIYLGMETRQDLFDIRLKDTITEGIVKTFYNDFARYFTIFENVVHFITTGKSADNEIMTTPGMASDTPPPPVNDNLTQTPPPPPAGGSSTPPPPPSTN